VLLGLPHAPATQLSMLVVRRVRSPASDVELGLPQFCWLLRMNDACWDEDW
jgi:hypothetical protein